MSHHSQGEENYEEMYKNMMEYLGVDEDPENSNNYEDSDKYKELVHNLNKKKELETIISERRVEL